MYERSARHVDNFDRLDRSLQLLSTMNQVALTNEAKAQTALTDAEVLAFATASCFIAGFYNEDYNTKKTELDYTLADFSNYSGDKSHPGHVLK